FPTKDDWRQPSQLAWIREGLLALESAILAYDIAEIAMPALGCGLGGLKWDDVIPVIYSVFEHRQDVNIILFPPPLPPMG
ncbi:MAG: macro domain-containing protein, partial [Waterburya sp.]